MAESAAVASCRRSAARRAAVWTAAACWAWSARIRSPTSRKMHTVPEMPSSVMSGAHVYSTGNGVLSLVQKSSSVTVRTPPSRAAMQIGHSLWG